MDIKEDIKIVDKQITDTGKIFGCSKEFIYVVGVLAIVGIFALFSGKL